MCSLGGSQKREETPTREGSGVVNGRTAHPFPGLLSPSAAPSVDFLTKALHTSL